jgi:hypothetical protein
MRIISPMCLPNIVQRGFLEARRRAIIMRGTSSLSIATSLVAAAVSMLSLARWAAVKFAMQRLSSSVISNEAARVVQWNWLCGPSLSRSRVGRAKPGYSCGKTSDSHGYHGLGLQGIRQGRVCMHSRKPTVYPVQYREDHR